MRALRQTVDFDFRESRMLNRWYIGAMSVAFVSLIGWQAYTHATRDRLAYVNVQQVFEDFTLKRELVGKLEQITTARQANLDSLKLRIQTMDEKDKSLQPLIMEYRRREQQYEELNTTLTEDYDRQIITQMNTYMKEFSEQQGYTIVLGANGSGSLIYAQPDLDITKEMTEYINRRYSGL